MNKKFSTLVAALLLSGALFTVDAKEVQISDFVSTNSEKVTFASGVMSFTGDVTFADYQDYLLIDEDNVTIEGNGYALNGRIVVTGKGVKIKNLTVNFHNGTPEAAPAGYDPTIAINKTAISAYTDDLEITGCTINCSSKFWIANAITVYPSAVDAKIVISDNTINNAKQKKGSFSSAIMIVEGLTSEGLASSNSAVLETPATVTGNKFEECAVDYVYADWSDGASYKDVQIEPLKDGSNLGTLAAYINGAAKDASIVFNGTAEDFNKAIADQSIDADVNAAIQCNDGNILYGDAKAPNDKPVIVADVKALDPAIDGYKLLKNIDSNYNLLVAKNSNGKTFVITVEGGVIVTKELTGETTLSGFAKVKNALWQVTESEDLDGNVYYSFKNQEGVQLKSSENSSNPSNNPTGLDGRFFSANNAKYNNGVVFACGPNGLKNSNKAYFGLYEAGKNEQDGFSVTIKYQDADGKFTKEDIAGNEFVGHLTPMKWNGQKFVEAPATDDKFYLKNADDEYIVVNAKDAGAIDTEDVLYFTTLTEEALVHHLARVYAGDDQEYFGEFQAKASASQTDPKKLTIIDEMNVNLADVDAASEKWASIGSWDVKGEPTLAASIETSLKPIQIALGSDKIVDKKAFLQKGKFYTIEGIASTSEDDYRVGKKLVAGAQSDENDYYWVKSYGNVLEGQFALTIASDKDGKEYYVFTNRENPDMLTYGLQLFELPNGGFSYGIPVGSLYTTDEDNEYRWGVLTMKIDTVAGHKASDGYQTLADVKNNKFYIGYASGVFGGNAWLVENHEGDENHVIGLDINQEDALIFTAKEYAAARQLKVEDKKSHKYYYAPSDSIYVISELGYFDGDDYKTTLDTLKLVSYSFVNQYTEPLIFSKNGENRYESKVYDYYKYNDKTGKYDIGVRYKNVEEAQKDAQHFALRIDGTKLNLRPVNPTVYSEDGNNVEVIEDSWSNIAWTETEYKNLGDDETKPDAYLYQGLNGNNKVYSGDAGEEGMLSNTYYLDREENDLFVVEPTEKPMYRTVINPLDTISIFRDDNSQSVLFEHNTFLGMENLSQYPEIAKAMIADTAYVRNNTYRPQYMLVVGADITPAGKWCPIHGDDPTCPDAHKVETSGWVEGRYLVNLVDTAIAWDAANKHKDNNPYINSEKYYRLGFVQAKHINDSLVIASTNDTLYVGSEDYNQAKFAFRYVDQEAGSFVIETANYNRLPGVEEAEINEDAPLGYLKWMNGVVVVVDDINNADVYNMNENETDTPTANEDIAVEEGVQVIAGNGAVTIQGAAGKTVVITNILGKAVANTTLTSDNQTINVPAGIVVVTVDGEAVKAIVK